MGTTRAPGATNPQSLVRGPRPCWGYSVALRPYLLSSRYRPLPSILPLLRTLRIVLPPPRNPYGLPDYLNTGLIRYVCILRSDTALLTADLRLRGFLSASPPLSGLELLLPNLSDRLCRPDYSLNYNRITSVAY